MTNWLEQVKEHARSVAGSGTIANRFLSQKFKSDREDTEQRLVASLVINPSDCYETPEFAKIKPGHISDHKLRKVFGAMREALAEAVGSDVTDGELLVALVDKLHDTSIDELYLAELMQSLPTGASFGHYAQRLLAINLRDQLGGSLGEVLVGLEDGTWTYEEAVTALHRIKDESFEELPEAKSSVEVFDSIYGDILSADNTPTPRRIISGLHEQDRILRTLKGGRLMTLAGRPGNGKSARTVWTAYQNADRGAKVEIYSWEMEENEYVSRFMSTVSGVAYQRIDDRDDLTKKDIERIVASAGAIEDLMSRIKFHCFLDPDEALARMANSDADLIIVDYVQKMALGYGGKDTQKRQIIDRLIANLFSLTRKHGKNIMALAQIKRKDPNAKITHMPTMEEIKESGGFEEMSDIVQTIQWPYKMGIQCEDPKLEAAIKHTLKIKGEKPWNPASCCWYRTYIAKQKAGDSGMILNQIIIPDTNRFYEIQRGV